MNKMTKVLIGIGVCLSSAVAIERIVSKYKTYKIKSKINDRLNDIAEDHESAEQISSMIGDIDSDKLNDVYVPEYDEYTEDDDDDDHQWYDLEDAYIKYIKNVEKNINKTSDNDDSSYEELKTIAEELKSFAEDNPIDIKESHYTEEPSNKEPIFSWFEADKTVEIPCFLEYIFDSMLNHVFELSLNSVNLKEKVKVRFDKDNKGYVYEHPNAPGYYIYYIGNVIYMYENNYKNALTFNKRTKEWDLNVTYHSAKIILNDVIHNENIDDENNTYWSFSNQIIVSDNISNDEEINKEMKEVVKQHAESLIQFFNKSLYKLLETF